MNPMMIVNPMAGMYGQMPMQQHYPYQQSYMQPQYQQQPQPQQQQQAAAATGEYDPNVYAQWFVPVPPTAQPRTSHDAAGTTITSRIMASPPVPSTHLLAAPLPRRLPLQQTPVQLLPLPRSPLPMFPLLPVPLQSKRCQMRSRRPRSWIEAPWIASSPSMVPSSLWIFADPAATVAADAAKVLSFYYAQESEERMLWLMSSV
jgi:hypothetical protein